jgi:hypothetical protein
VAPGRILTARHVLFPANRDHNRSIQVRWYHQEGQLREWKEVKKILWHGDGEIDVAVIECVFPTGVEGYARLIDAKPKNNDLWEGAGFAIAGQKNNGRWPPVTLGGTVREVADNEWEFQLGENYPVSRASLWQGASGSPVFNGNGMIGVIVAAPEAFNGSRFDAISIWKLLTIAGFAESIPDFTESIGGGASAPNKRNPWFLCSLVKTDAQTKQIKQLVPEGEPVAAGQAIACVFTDFNVECPDSLAFKIIHQFGSDQHVAEQLTLADAPLGTKKAEDVLWELLRKILHAPSATAGDIQDVLQQKRSPKVFELDLGEQVNNHAWIAEMAKAWERLTFADKGHHHYLILLHTKHEKPWFWRRWWLKRWVSCMQKKCSQGGRVIKPDPTPALRKPHLYAWINAIEPLGLDTLQQSELKVRVDRHFQSSATKTYLDIRVDMKADLQAVLSQPDHSGSSS